LTARKTARKTARRTEHQPEGSRPDALEAPEPPDELGELSFEDWYSRPIFETDVDRDERLEHLAMSRRRPARLLGGARVRLAARHSSAATAPPDDEPAGDEPAANEPAANEPAGNEPAANGSGRDPGFGAPARHQPQGESWRDRAGRLLDRWAEHEAAGQERLEQAVLPRRWRG
jgi:hypothetical protein